MAVAGLLAATRITKKKMSENTIMFLGAGSVSTQLRYITNKSEEIVSFPNCQLLLNLSILN